MTQTKHQQVISHIESLNVGDKVSVRQLARELGVSEGTVYRAIKDAENQGYVTSIPKVGTLRIEKNTERTIDSLTYHELSLLLEGKLVSGLAYKDELPKSYFVPQSVEDLDSANVGQQTIIITAKNEGIIEKAFQLGLPLLLAGDYDVSDLPISEESEQVVLTCPYQIFELISVINRTIFERVKHREFVMVSDIMSEKPDVIFEDETVADYFIKTRDTGHSRFPVLNRDEQLVGIVTSPHIANQHLSKKIGDIMLKNPVTARPDDMMSYLARLFVLEKTEIVPVKSLDDRLAGVVTRQDVIVALQNTQKQPQFGDTMDIIVLSGFELTNREPEVEISGTVTDFMLDESGEASIGNLAIIMSNAATIAARMKENHVYQCCQQNINVLEPIVEGMNICAKVSLNIMRDGEIQAFVRIMSNGIVLSLGTMVLLRSGK